MGVSIKWQPFVGVDITPGARSSFQEALQGAFGDGHAWVLARGDVPTLEGMQAAFAVHASDESAIAVRKLITAIQEHGAIRVWCEW